MMSYSKVQTSTLKEQTFAYIEVLETGNLLTITLNRPQAKNAMSPTMVREYGYALSYAHHHAHIWAVVFQAKGDVWCAGADLKAMRGQEEANNSTIPKPEQELVIGNLFEHIHKPVIAKVHANVYAGGFLLVGGANYVVATQNVVFALPEVKRGIYPFQVVASLLKIMPARKALDLCIRAKSIDAQEAFQLNLVTDIAKDETELQEITDKIVAEIFASSPSAIRLGLKAFDEMRSIADNEQHAYLAKMLIQTISTADAQEGLKAFAEKRKPVWTGN